ncbi:hypothetical protein [Salinarimonas soli]|uniref:Uncharacterized protein n=1 Tax=Salinarimonas soli TaxID=1638099 RepID=A0A5B2V9C2_9HYPH|nr:hypothetical protein [Salinarimonas soli]KAA2234939.1 hypothetical protein F0L46_21595 [Salinarimonas soli]
MNQPVTGKHDLKDQKATREPADKDVDQTPVDDRQQGQTLAKKTNEHLEEKVDESLEETFPASDPPSFNITR